MQYVRKQQKKGPLHVKWKTHWFSERHVCFHSFSHSFPLLEAPSAIFCARGVWRSCVQQRQLWREFKSGSEWDQAAPQRPADRRAASRARTHNRCPSSPEFLPSETVAATGSALLSSCRYNGSSVPRPTQTLLRAPKPLNPRHPFLLLLRLGLLCVPPPCIERYLETHNLWHAAGGEASDVLRQQTSL